MNDRDIEQVLHQAARSIPVPRQFQSASAIAHETAARHRRQRLRTMYAVGAAAAAGRSSQSRFGSSQRPSPPIWL